MVQGKLGYGRFTVVVFIVIIGFVIVVGFVFVGIVIVIIIMDD